MGRPSCCTIMHGCMRRGISCGPPHCSSCLHWSQHVQASTLQALAHTTAVEVKHTHQAVTHARYPGLIYMTSVSAHSSTPSACMRKGHDLLDHLIFLLISHSELAFVGPSTCARRLCQRHPWPPGQAGHPLPAAAADPWVGLHRSCQPLPGECSPCTCSFTCSCQPPVFCTCGCDIPLVLGVPDS